MPRHEGYRYVRQYGSNFSRDPRKDKSKPAWALWQMVGGRKRRVGYGAGEVLVSGLLVPWACGGALS
jgi:hypothetical protein